LADVDQDMTLLAIEPCQPSVIGRKPLPLATAEPELRGPHLRRALSFVTIAWIFGAVWQSATTGAPLTLFATSLRASQFQFGLLSALPFIASLISVPASLITERTGLRKRIFFWGNYPNRLLWFPIALIPMYLVHRFGNAGFRPAMIVFLLLMFLMHSGGAVGGPAWTSWMADVVPGRSRGKYFSRRRQWGIVTAIPAALLAGWMLDRLGASANPMLVMKWCAILFMCGAAFGFWDIHFFNRVPDHSAPPPRRASLLGIFAEPMRDAQFLWFAALVGMLTFALSFMNQFVALYMLEKLGSTSTQVQLMLLVAPMIAQLLVLPIWGCAADRMGKKPVLVIASLGLIPVGFGWCFCSKELLWLGYLLSALGAALWVGVEVANQNLVLEVASSSDEKSRSGGGSNYVAVNSVIINIAGCLGGLCAGVIAQALANWRWNPHILGPHEWSAYELLFALSGMLRLLAAIVFLPMIHEPSARSAGHTLRFMLTNIWRDSLGRFPRYMRSRLVTPAEIENSL
jgi:MFS family permease